MVSTKPQRKNGIYHKKATKTTNFFKMQAFERTL